MFPGEQAPGQFLIVGGNEWEVVGVVEDVRHQSLEQTSGIELYMPMTQRGWGTLDMVVRSPLPPQALFGGVSIAIQRPAVPPTQRASSRKTAAIPMYWKENQAIRIVG